MSLFHPLDASALDQLFVQARTYNSFSGEIDDATLHRLYDLLKNGPTAANSTPARFVFVRSAEAKARLEPALDAGNHDKTMAAPVTVIVAYDLDFHHKLPLLFPHTDARAWFEGPAMEKRCCAYATSRSTPPIARGCRARPIVRRSMRAV